MLNNAGVDGLCTCLMSLKLKYFIGLLSNYKDLRNLIFFYVQLCVVLFLLGWMYTAFHLSSREHLLLRSSWKKRKENTLAIRFIMINKRRRRRRKYLLSHLQECKCKDQLFLGHNMTWIIWFEDQKLIHRTMNGLLLSLEDWNIFYVKDYMHHCCQWAGWNLAS